MKVFQPVLCVVTAKGVINNDKQKKNNTKNSKQSQQIHLSMRGSSVNRYINYSNLQRGCKVMGCVQSIEDHG